MRGKSLSDIKAWLLRRGEAFTVAVLSLAFLLLVRWLDIGEAAHEYLLPLGRFVGFDEMALTFGFAAIMVVSLSARKRRLMKQEVLRRKTAEALASEERHNLQNILDATPFGIVIVSMDKTVLFANRAALEMTGHGRLSEMVGRICHESFCPAERDKCPIIDMSQSVDRSEKVRVKVGGERIPILKSVVPFSFDGEDVLLEAFVDITEYKKNEAFIRDILENVDEAFVVVDRDYRIISANRSYCQQLKLDPGSVVGMRCHMASHGFESPCHMHGEECPVSVTFQKGVPGVVTHVHRDSDEGDVYVESKSYPLRDPGGNIYAAIEIINDVTEKNKLEEQLRHSQKMEAIGTLTGGVAHEFNNILTAIMGFSEFLHDALPPESQEGKYADYIHSSAHRAARLTQSLLAYSRKQISHMKPTDINTVIRNMEGFIRTLAGTRVRVSVETSGAPLMVIADEGQIEQVLMNLCTNAFEAIRQDGTLEISASQAAFGEQRVFAQAAVPPGQYALVTVRDSGAGMAQKVMAKIFEPFFTTKDVGKGTGLGLSMVYGIVKRHEGYITAESEPGRGSLFSIYLPLAEGAAPAREPLNRRSHSPGHETILVAEDDPAVRELVDHSLRASGYRTILATDGHEAVAAVEANRGKVDLILMDLSMPGMGGLEAYGAISGIEPGLPVIFISGYLASDPRMRELTSAGHAVVGKPLSPRDLLAKIRDRLG